MYLSYYNSFFALFVLFLSPILASCPNNCNNHGTCTNNACLCNPLIGLGLSMGFQVPAYTGADCSMRTCPLGFPFGATYRELTVEPAPEFIVGGTIAPSSDPLRALGAEQTSPKVETIPGMGQYAYKITNLGDKAMSVIDQLNKEGGVISCTYGGIARPPRPTQAPTTQPPTQPTTQPPATVPTTTEEDEGTDEATPIGIGLRELLEVDKDTEVILPSKKGRADVKGWSYNEDKSTNTVFIVFDREVGENDTNVTYSISYITFNSIISMRTDLTLYNPTAVTDNKIVWSGYGDVLATMGFTFSNVGTRLLDGDATTTPVNVSLYKFACFNSTGTIYDYFASKAIVKENNVIFEFTNDSRPADNMQCLLLFTSDNRTVDITDSDASDILDVKDGNIVVKIPGTIDPSDSGRSNSTVAYDGNTITFEFPLETSENIIEYAATNNAILFPIECYEDSKLNVVEGNSMTIKFGLARDPFTIDIMAISDKEIGGLGLSFQSDELGTKFTQLKSSPVTARMLQQTFVESYSRSVSISIGENGVRSARECSGAGYCNRVSGECECLPGYDGDACQRMSCPNNCNGNGRCVTLSDIVSGTDIYLGYGNRESNMKVYACKCEPGRRGSDCSLIECPSGEDPLLATNTEAGKEYRDCSGRGKCDYATGVCTCFNGFSGDGCQNQISNS